MRAREILESASVGATGAGSVASVSQPLITASRGSLLAGKYTNDPTPNTPDHYKRKSRADRRFKNSPGN